MRLNESYKELQDVVIQEYPAALRDKVIRYGTRVRFTMDGSPDDINIVSFGDNDFNKNRILYTSPLAKALLNHREGESYEATINGRTSRIQVEEVLTITDPELLPENKIALESDSNNQQLRGRVLDKNQEVNNG